MSSPCHVEIVLTEKVRPQDYHRALGVVLLKGPRGALFIMNDVPCTNKPDAESIQRPSHQIYLFESFRTRWIDDDSITSGCWLLKIRRAQTIVEPLRFLYFQANMVHGFLAHEKTPTPLRPP